jgi:hypothetical protein
MKITEEQFAAAMTAWLRRYNALTYCDWAACLRAAIEALEAPASSTDGPLRVKAVSLPVEARSLSRDDPLEMDETTRDMIRRDEDDADPEARWDARG